MTLFLSGCIHFFAILHIHSINAKYCGYQLGRKYENKEPCTKLEHCKNEMFDEKTGACLGSGNHCEPGWMGPGCQYLNLAFSTSKKDQALDGLMSTSRWTGTIEELTLPGVFIVSAVNIILDQNSYPLSVTITVNEGIAIYNGTLQMNSTAYFKHAVRTNRLLFTFPRSLEIKEIEVFGGKNVALWKETSQSSTYKDSPNYMSDNAVDGWDSNHYFFNNTCIHTLPHGQEPFWSVNLGTFYRILSVYISNRGDNRARINGFTLHVKVASGEERLIYTDKQQNSRNDIWIDSSYMPSELVNEVIIRGDNISKEKIINLCEVYVLACIPSEYGTSDCQQLFPKNCHPSVDMAINNLSCPVCLPGWTGDYCDIKKENRYCKYHKGRKISNKGNCTRQEHCLGKFRETDGQCTSPRNQCEPGWMGPGCQYVNLAYKAHNTSPSLDGNLNTSEAILHIQIDLKGTFIISALNIHAKATINATIKTLNNEICYIGRITEGSPLVFCNYVLRTRSLIISFTRNTTVLEIEIFGGRNVALWKKTSQTSTYKNKYTSDKAVDGWDSDGYVMNDSCTHTDEVETANGPSWSVNLGNLYAVISIRIANRNNLEERLNGFQLFGINSSGLKQLMHEDPKSENTPPRNPIWVDSSIMRSNVYWKLTIDGKNLIAYHGYYKILTLCEVEVFACRLTENAGEDCVNFCPKNCHQTENCLNENFTCPKCDPGWKGPHCTQVIYCGRPIVEKRNMFLSPDSFSYAYNTTVYFTCPEGFNIRGSTQAVCGPNETFIFYDSPSCEAVTCSNPDHSSNVMKEPLKEEYKYNETIYFSCVSGYFLQTSTSAVCKKDGFLYTNGHPQCKEIQCNSSTLRSSNLVLYPPLELYTYNETITFSCKEGYNLRGAKSGRCLKSNDIEFTPGDEEPHCEAVQCNKSSLLMPNSILTPNNSTYNYLDIIYISCSEGYNLHGASFLYCGQNNTLSYNGTPTYCEAIKCNETAIDIPHIDIDDRKSYNYKETKTFTCSEGFIRHGSAKGTCTATNSFLFSSEYGDPSCQAIKCNESAIIIENLLINTSIIYNYNQTKEFKCKEGFMNTGSKEGTCKIQDGFEYSSKLGDPFCQENVGHFETIIGALTGGTLGGLGILALIIIALILLRRKSTNIKAAATPCPANNNQTLCNLDNQYAEINPLRKKKDTTTPTESNDGSPTYYNLNTIHKDNKDMSSQNVYYEFAPASKPSETAVKLSLFKDYVESKKRQTNFFSDQFKKFYTGLQFPATAAVASGNKSKNKYKNIYPYDDTRVTLNTENETAKSDYINASFIHGYGNIKTYIAAQGPLVDTIDDFWSMVWNENCGKIVMLTNLKENDKVKCIQYWPEEDMMKKGNHTIEVVDTEVFADFTIRTFCLKKNNEQRIIRHFHFTAWPDKGVPLYASSLVHFHSKVKNTTAQGKGTLIVHCSAGIGRTGTFIALDFLIQQAKESGFIDVFRCVETLRRQRVNMVQTLEQYIFLHDALVEALMCTSSDPSTTEFTQIYRNLMKVDPKSGKRNIDLYFENLYTGWAEIPQTACDIAKNPENRRKNRYSNILPVEGAMPQIWDEEYKTIYINAVFLPAYKNKRSFIVTQIPLRETVVDFWRLVYLQHVSTIVLLNEVEENASGLKQNIGKYWPEGNGSVQYGPYTITKETVMSTDEDEIYNVIKLICSVEEEEERLIKIFKCKFWRDSETVPSSISPILKLINDVEMHHNMNNTGPIVVQCMNGAEKSGLFCVLQVVLERMKIEQDVAIHQVIQHMRSVRPSIISNVGQLKFCYDVVMEFMKQFDTYSNFQ